MPRPSPACAARRPAGENAGPRRDRRKAPPSRQASIENPLAAAPSYDRRFDVVLCPDRRRPAAARPGSAARVPAISEGHRRTQPFHQRIKWPTPSGVRTASFAARGKTFETRLVAGDLLTLLYCANLAIISQDVWLSRISQPDKPDFAVFDLDPGPGVSFAQVVDIARRLHELLEDYGVPHGVKTSGMGGVHVYVPVVHTDYATTRAFVTQFASRVAAQCPDSATIERAIHRRGKRVYIDPDQNMRAKTMAAPYSVRHSAFAGVSAPVSWQELEEGARPEDFTLGSMLERVKRVGDLWTALGEQPLDLRRLLESARSRRQAAA
ncbi:MAG TPA: hypothetical protein VFS39_16460 [Nitrospira sp.]|nr:hypothetical protein [Nitrospira sp.]